MFASGSARLQPYFEEILLALSDTIAVVPKKISIGGHTDAQPFIGRSNYGNWELSTERANAARRTLLVAGYPEGQLARVVGYADSALFDRSIPNDPVNRRIDIVVLNKRAEEHILKNSSESVESEDSVIDDQPLDAQAAEFDALQATDAVPALPGSAPDGPVSQPETRPEPDSALDPESVPANEGQRPANLFDDVNALEPLRNQ
tara:strand:- start:353 stop:964 length:612 start_codon:yes stop_codon:yes gene_type:complete